MQLEEISIDTERAFCTCLHINGKLFAAREAIKDIRQMVQYTEVSTPHRDRILDLGYLGGVFLDGIRYRPYELMGTSNMLREEIIRLCAQERIRQKGQCTHDRTIEPDRQCPQ